MRALSARVLTVRAIRSALGALVLALAAPAVAGAVSMPSAMPAASPQQDALSAALARADGGVSALAVDDDIPGIVVVSPYTNSITLNSGDWLDVLQVTIPAHTVFTAEIVMSPGEWVAGALFPPGSSSLNADPEPVPVTYSEIYSDTSDRLTYYSDAGGTYYLVLFPGDDGSGDFFGDGTLGYTVTFQSNALTGDSDVGTAIALPVARSDSLNWQTDVNDVYSVVLSEGQQLYVTMTPNTGLDFSLAVYGPGSPSVWGPDAILAQYDAGTGTDEITWLVPPGGAGTYHVEVSTGIYTGGYQMQSQITRPNVPRVSGANRYSTSTAISKSTWVTSDSVVLATGAEPADALAASGVAGVLDAPVILVPQYSKFSSLVGIYRELDRLECSTVYIVGGFSAVDGWIDQDLEDLGYDVTRLYGSNRYLTAAAVAQEMSTAIVPDTAFVVRGDDYADALAVSPYAYAHGIPVLLTKTGVLHSATAAFIEDNDILEVVVAGGAVAVSDDVVAQLEALNGGATNVVRRFGSNRYSTARSVADYAVDDMGWGSWDFLGVATGQSFPDALSGGAVCGQRGGVMLLTKSTELRNEVAGAIEGYHPGTAMIFGGVAAVSDDVKADIQTLMPPP